MRGEQLGALDGHSMPRGKDNRISLGMDSYPAGNGVRVKRIFSNGVIAVGYAGRGAVVARTDGSAVPSDHRAHVQPAAGRPT